MVGDNVVFFDGHCHLCNRSVNWLLKRDKKNRLKYAPLQGETAQKLIPEESTKYDSLIFCSNDKVYIKSSGFIRIVLKLTWPWKFLSILWIIPYPIRDWGYDFVARKRYKWFGKSEHCRIPTSEERTHFLS